MTTFFAALFVLLFAFMGVCFYAAKRFFDDRAAARDIASGLNQQLIDRLAQLTAGLATLESTLRTELDTQATLIRDRLGVFERGLENSIAQFSALINEQLKQKALTAGAILKSGRRPPP